MVLLGQLHGYWLVVPWAPLHRKLTNGPRLWTGLGQHGRCPAALTFRDQAPSIYSCHSWRIAAYRCVFPDRIVKDPSKKKQKNSQGAQAMTLTDPAAAVDLSTFRGVPSIHGSTSWMANKRVVSRTEAPEHARTTSLEVQVKWIESRWCRWHRPQCRWCSSEHPSV